MRTRTFLLAAVLICVLYLRMEYGNPFNKRFLSTNATRRSSYRLFDLFIRTKRFYITILWNSFGLYLWQRSTTVWIGLLDSANSTSSTSGLRLKLYVYFGIRRTKWTPSWWNGLACNS